MEINILNIDQYEHTYGALVEFEYKNRLWVLAVCNDELAEATDGEIDFSNFTTNALTAPVVAKIVAKYLELGQVVRITMSGKESRVISAPEEMVLWEAIETANIYKVILSPKTIEYYLEEGKEFHFQAIKNLPIAEALPLAYNLYKIDTLEALLAFKVERVCA